MKRPTITQAKQICQAAGARGKCAKLGKTLDAFCEEIAADRIGVWELKYISLFSGIEAATVAWEPLEWKPVAFAEIEPFPSALLAHRYPGVPNLGDVSAVDWSPYRGIVDVVVGGSPCQAFSVAGLRKSLEDPRGNLTLEYVRAVHAIRPRYAVWENVPGVLSTSDNAFGCFLAALVGADEALAPEESWPGAGMVSGPGGRAAWRLLDAQFFGLAQRRLRVFVVFCPGGGADPAEVLFERPRLRFSLNEHGMKNMRRLVKKYGIQETLIAIEQALDSIPVIDSDSVEKAFDRVGQICQVRKECGGDDSKIQARRLRGLLAHILNKRYIDYQEALEWIEVAQSRGHSDSTIKYVITQSSSYTNFVNRIRNLIGD